MISIFLQKKHTKWSVVCQYRDEETKKRRQKVLGSFEKKRDANAKLIEEQAKLQKDLFVIPKDITVSHYLNEWLNLRVNSIQKSTYVYYKEMIDLRFNNKTAIGRIKLQEVTPMHIERFYIKLCNEVSTNTAIKYHRMLKKALGDAKRKQIITVNPVELVDPPQKSKKTVGQTLTQKEALQYIEAAKNTSMELPVNFALVLGFRASEICGIGLNKIDFEENKIIIDQVTYRDRIEKKVKLKEVKTRSSNRISSVPPQLMELIKKQYETSKNNQNNKLNLLITKEDGSPMDSSALSSNFKKFQRSRNLKIVRFHDLRHTNASLHLQLGTPLKVTSKNLGHSSIGITADLYTHVLTGLEEKAIENIGNLFY